MTIESGLRWTAWIGGLICGALGAAALAWWTYEARYGWPTWPFLTVVLQFTGFALGTISSVGVARSAARSRLTVLRLCVALCGLMAATLASFSFFDGPMHDIALSWGSHGRWGCMVVDDSGRSVYLVTSQTLPLLLFAPPLIVVASLGMIVLRRARLANRPLNPPDLRPAG